MTLPRTRLTRHSPLRVEVSDNKNIPRLLLLIVLLRVYTAEGADYIKLYRRYKAKATVFFDECASGTMKPSRNEFQTTLNSLLPGSDQAHLYIGTTTDRKATHYISLIRGQDGLWRLRHRKIRRASEQFTRSGVFASWGDTTPLPDIACNRTPTLDRVLMGGRACEDFVKEAEAVFEVRRQLSHCAMVCELFGCLHRDEIVTWHEPGRVVLHVNRVAGDGWVQPYEFSRVVVRPYAQAGLKKARVLVWGSASDNGLYAAQSPRCILPTVKGASEYQTNAQNPGESKLLAELLLSRLLPFVGILGAEGRVALYGLHYDINKQEGVIGLFAKDRSLRACEGLPLVRPSVIQADRLWTPNLSLLTLMREQVYDLTPAEDARLDRWYSFTRVMRYFGVSDPNLYPDYFARHGLPLPDDAKQHIATLVFRVQAVK